MTQHTHLPSTMHAGAERRLLIAMWITGGFIALEIGGGIYTHSLALLADAGHLFGDFVALALAWAAFRAGRRSPDLRRSFGYHRFQVLAAFVNGLALLGIAVWIVIAALGRMWATPTVLAGPMMVIAIIGLAVNILVFWILSSSDEMNLNLRGAVLHVVGDVLGSLAAIAASLVIMFTGWMQADPLLSMLAAGLILRAGFRIVRESGHILLEGTPEEVDPERVGAELMQTLPNVLDVHHVHIWSLTEERPVLTLHARVAAHVEHDRIMHDIHRALESLFGVSHATVQLEYGPCTDEMQPDG